MSLAFLFPSLMLATARKRNAMRESSFSLKQLALLIALILLVSPGWAKEAAPVAEDPEIERRMIALSEDLRCLVCQNETLADSRADLAVDLRNEIREQMKAGKTDQEIIAFLTVRYGDFVLLKPRFDPSTALLWFGPFVILLTAVLIMFRRRKRPQAVEEGALSADERAALERLTRG